MQRIAIFASGTGSNARKIVEYFQQNQQAQVALIVSNKKDAKVLDLAAEYDISTHLLQRSNFYETEQLLDILKKEQIDLLVLAGFLWLIPPYLVRAYPQAIINIHPALLPKYGGKGMYGRYVHEAVKAAGERESGITIHYVNEQYDEGDIIFQASCPIEAADTPEQIFQKVQELEHRHFPEVLAQLLDQGNFIPSKR